MTSLWNACNEGNLPLVQSELQKPGTNVNIQGGPRNDPAITVACRNGHRAIVEVLLAHPAIEVNIGNKWGGTAIGIAAQEGFGEVVDLLLADQRVLWNQASSSGTPISSACQFNHFGIVSKFQQHRRRLHGLTPEEDLQNVNNRLDDLSNCYENITQILYFIADHTTRGLVISSGLFPRLCQLFDQLQELRNFSTILRTVIGLSKVESLRKEFLKNKGYVNLIRKVLVRELTDFFLEIRLLLLTGKDVREAVIQEFPDFRKIILSLYPRLAANWQRIDLSGVVLLMIGHEAKPTLQDIGVAVTVVKKAYSEWPVYDRERMSDSIMAASSNDGSRPILLQMGIKELMRPFLNDPESPEGFTACLIQSLLAASDVSTTHESGGEPTSPVAIKRVIEALNFMATTKATNIDTTNGNCADCSIILLALRSLATNEANLKTLKEKGAVSVLLALFKNRHEDLLADNRENLEEAANLTWVLSFDRDCRDELIAGQMIPILKSLNINDHEGVQRAIGGALWNLETEEKQTKAVTNQQQVEKAGHIMISYSWGQKERMRELAAYLKSLGFPIWLDIEQMEGSVLERMSEAVEEAALVVVGLSSTYKESQACRTEAEYAYRLKKEVVFVMAEDSFIPKGWLGAMLGNKLFYNPWASKDGFEDIVKQLKKHLTLAPNPAAPATVPTTAPTPAVASAPVTRSSSRNARNYDGVKIPDNKEPLPLSSLNPEGVATWEVEEVCRWLVMKKLDKLLAPFVWHQIRGVSLIEISCLQNEGFETIWNQIEVEEVGLRLEFARALRELLRGNPSSWTTLEVTRWLAVNGLEDFAKIAQVEEWDGSVLAGFHVIRKESTFAETLKEIGIQKPSQRIRFIAKLGNIFG